MWNVSLPITARSSKAKRIPLNINYYRNAHYQILDKAKKNFKSEVAGLIHDLPKLPTPVRLTYTLFIPNRQSRDVANICCIVDKFFCDALVEFGRLPDDDFENVVSVLYNFGGVDRAHPRVECLIESIEGTSAYLEPDSAEDTHLSEPTKEKTVKITMVQTEIEEAMRNHIRSMINLNDGMSINMTFSATRGEDGLIADIEISPTKAAPPAHAARVTTTRASEPTVTRAPSAPAGTTTTVTKTSTPSASPFKRPAKAAAEDTDVAGEGYVPRQLAAHEEEVDEQPGEEPDLEGGAEDEPAEEETPPAAKGPSIFSGLRRPGAAQASAE